MLEVSDLRAGYGRIEALAGVSLNVAAGEIVALVGPNGAGKSTLLSCVSGLVKPWKGAITLDGISMRGLAPEAIARRGVSLVPEGRGIFTRMSVAENLTLGATIKIPGPSVTDRLADAYTRFPALRKLAGTTAGKLSGGEQQQLAIARALMASPRLLLVDEPSLGLAPQIVDLVFDVFADLRDMGVTILLVEQHALRAIELADRSYIMRDGRIAAGGTAKDLEASPRIAEAYLGGVQ